MAKRKVRYRTRTVYRTVRSKAGSLLSGDIGNIIAGAVAGAGVGFMPDDMLGGWGDVAVLGALGWFMKNRTLTTLAGFFAGQKLIGSKNTVGGGWL